MGGLLAATTHAVVVLEVPLAALMMPQFTDSMSKATHLQAAMSTARQAQVSSQQPAVRGRWPVRKHVTRPDCLTPKQGPSQQ
jgi:hypothetical protein